MSVLRSRRNISKTEYENTLANLYRYSMNKTIAVPKRRRKWLCTEIDGIMNKVYSDVMELGTGYIPDADKKEEFTVKTVNDSVRSLYLLQKPLLVLWNVQRYETKVMVEWASFIKKELLLLDTLIGREGEICNMVILDWRVINSVNFLKNMSELHRYTHGKVANACMAYDNTHGKLLIDTVNDAFYYLMLANRKIPTTQKEYIKRKEYISKSISCLNKMNRGLLFYFNLMKYSERVMNEWSEMLTQELKMLHALQKSDKSRFEGLK